MATSELSSVFRPVEYRHKRSLVTAEYTHCCIAYITHALASRQWIKSAESTVSYRWHSFVTELWHHSTLLIHA